MASKSPKAKIMNASAVIAIIVFIIGAYLLILIRFELGHNYQYYSSLREDPLGTKGLFESINALPDKLCSRNYRPLALLEKGNTKTLMILGLNTESLDLSDSSIKANQSSSLNKFIDSGGRVVISTIPNLQTTIELPDNTSINTSSSDKGISFAILSKQKIDWHSDSYIDCNKEQWEAIAENGEFILAAERKVGNGSIVISTDSYLFSNEALKKSYSPTFLSRVIGNSSEIVFDETHLGSIQQSGVATLARQHNLKWLLFALLAVAAVFIWKSITSFIPRSEETSSQLRGNDITPPKGIDGLASLISHSTQKSITSLDICVKEFKQSNPNMSKTDIDCLNKIKAILSKEKFLKKKKQNIVAAYQAMCNVYNNRHHQVLSDRHISTEQGKE